MTPIKKGHLAAVSLAFLASGVASLVYQTVWVRAFGNVFGNTVHSAAVVTALFMAGLGLGGWYFGRLADRRVARSDAAPAAGGGDVAAAELYRLYALLEAGIGLFGVVASLAVPLLEPLSGLVGSYVQGADGLFRPSVGTHLVRYAAATVLLLPTTLCMGGTLTVLVRALVRERAADAGPRLGLLYGLNTLGAAAGAFAVDAWLVPLLGLRATQSAAAAVNLCICLVALQWARAAARRPAVPVPAIAASPPHAQDTTAPPASPPNPLPAAPHAQATTSAAPVERLVSMAALALALAGFAGMGYEILWFRVLGAALGAHRSTFSLLLTTLLFGLFVGAALAGLLLRRLSASLTQDPARVLARVFAAVQGLLALAALVCLARYDLADYLEPDLVRRHAEGAEGGRSVIEAWMTLRPMMGVVLVPAILMGLAYPLVNAAVQQVLAQVGARAGLLYLANSAGGIVGSLATGFALIPALGMQTTSAALAAVTLLSAAPLLVVTHKRNVEARLGGASLAAAGGLGLGVIALVAFLALPSDQLVSRLATVHIVGEKVLVTSEGPQELVAISEDPATGARTLWTNGHPMTGTAYMAQRYMRAFVHVPLLMHPDPRRVLVICFGVGNTVSAASLYPELESIEVADLSEHVVSFASYFERWNHGVVNDPRVSIYINDGRQHLRTLPEDSLDLVTLEPPPLTHAGVAALYSREFYELARSRLRPGGYITQWLPIYQVPGDVAVSMIAAFIEAFPGGVLLAGYGRELILLGTRDRRVIFDPDVVGQRLSQHPEVLADLKAIDLDRLTDLATTFAGSAERMKALSHGMLALTDDAPVLEYSPDKLPEAIIPGDLFGPDELKVFCPKCGPERADLPHLYATTRLNHALYQSDVYRVVARTRGPIRPGFHVRRVKARAAHDAWAASRYLRRLIPESALPPLTPQ